MEDMMDIKKINEKALAKMETCKNLKFSEILQLRKEYPYYDICDISISGHDFKLFSANDDPIALTFLWNKTIEPLEEVTLKLWDAMLEPNMICADIGAHVGLFSLFTASKHKTVTMYSFEPVSFIYARLYVNMLINNFTKIKPQHLAIGNHVGKIEINVRFQPTFLSTGSSLHEDKMLQSDAMFSETVNITTVDNFFQDIDINLIKISVEHNEVNTLLGSKETLQKKRPTIIIEILSSDDKIFIFKNFVSDFDYTFFVINDSKSPTQEIKNIQDMQSLNPKFRNFILVPVEKKEKLLSISL